MAKPTSPKKSETIEIRLSHAAKTAFMERCRRDARTASEELRLFIEERIAPAPRPRPMPHWRMVAAALAGAALGVGAAAPSLARSSGGSHAAFDRLDRDRDGVLTYTEFRSR